MCLRQPDMSPTRALLVALLIVTMLVDIVVGQSSTGPGSSVISDCVTLCYTGVINQDGCQASDLRCHCENRDSIIAEMPRCVATRPECRNQDPTVFTDAVSMYCQRILASSFSSSIPNEEITATSPTPSSVVSVPLFPTTLPGTTDSTTTLLDTSTSSHAESESSTQASWVVSHVSSSTTTILAPTSVLFVSYPVLLPSLESSILVEPIPESYPQSFTGSVSVFSSPSYGLTSMLVSTLLNFSTSTTSASSFTTTRVPLANSTSCPTSNMSSHTILSTVVPTSGSCGTCTNINATVVPTISSTRPAPFMNTTISLPMGPGPVVNPTLCMERCPGNATSRCLCPTIGQSSVTVTTTLTVSALPACTETLVATNPNGNSNVGATTGVTPWPSTDVGHSITSGVSTFTFAPVSPGSIVAIFTGTGIETPGYQGTGLGFEATVYPTGCGNGPTSCHSITVGTGNGNGIGGIGGGSSSPSNTTSSYFAGSMTAPVVAGGAPPKGGELEDLIYLLAAYMLLA